MPIVAKTGNLRMDLTGRKFKNLVVLREDAKRGQARLWLCKCKCGDEIVVYQSNLLKRPEMMCTNCRNKSRQLEEGLLKVRAVYEGMLGRCYSDADAERFEYYGGRGITVCDRWREPGGVGLKNFYEDMGERPEGTTLDRIDVNGNYNPENCRWADSSLQGYNRRHLKKTESGHVGVYISAKKYRAVISFRGEVIELGYFYKIEDAIAARKSAELKYYGFNKE